MCPRAWGISYSCSRIKIRKLIKEGRRLPTHHDDYVRGIHGPPADRHWVWCWCRRAVDWVWQWLADSPSRSSSPRRRGEAEPSPEKPVLVGE